MTTGLKVFIFTQATNISADRHDILMQYVIVPCKDAVQSKNVQFAWCVELAEFAGVRM